MSENLQPPKNNQKLIKFLTKTIKKAVSDKGINPTTKKGNKELALLLKNLSKKTFSSQEEVKSYGEKLGAVIIEISQSKDKNYLDKGVIREITFQNKLSAFGDRSNTISQSAPSTTTLNKTFQPVENVKTKEKLSPKTEESKSVKDFKPVTEIIEQEEENTVSSDEIVAKLEEGQTEKPLKKDASVLAEDEVDLAEEEDSTIADNILAKEEVKIEEEFELEEELEITEKVLEEDEDTDEESKAIAFSLKNPKEAVEKEEKNLAATNEKDSSSISLKDRLTEDIKLAMKAKDKIRLETVRGIKKAVLEKEVELRPSGQESLTKDQEIELLAQQAKQRRESIEQYQKAERDDLAEKESQELAIIETYLPKQLSDEELESVLDEIIASVGATSSKDIGKVMGTAMKQLKGKADGKKIQSLVKSKLNS